MYTRTTKLFSKRTWRFLWVLLSIPLAVFAVGDSVIVTQLVTTGDLTPPSVPASVLATSISTSQIDITWSTSTDNVAMSHYRVFRDTAFLASTTLTSYSDTGLTPDTSYAYTVSAVDIASNESARSATSTATTASLPPPPPAPTPEVISAGGLITGILHTLRIESLSVDVGMENAKISWWTNNPAISTLSWGETVDTEIATLSETYLDNVHVTNIENLSPDTTYYVTLEARDANNTRAGVTRLKFRTLPLPDTEAPSNITDFTAIGHENEIALSWENPADTDFDAVRIMRSDRFFPAGIEDGRLIYEGAASAFSDTNVEGGKTYYYTAFARDKTGNYSSGALAYAFVPRSEDEISVIPVDPFENIPESPHKYPEIEQLSILDFDFIQDGKKISFLGSTIAIDGMRNLTISLDYDKVPEVLKTIGVALKDPEDPGKIFAFLLRVNDEKTAYEATIAPLQRNGTFRFGLTILDFKNQSVRKLSGSLVVQVPLVFAGEQTGPRTTKESYVTFLAAGALALIVLALLIIARKLLANRREETTAH